MALIVCICVGFCLRARTLTAPRSLLNVSAAIMSFDVCGKLRIMFSSKNSWYCWMPGRFTLMKTSQIPLARLMCWGEHKDLLSSTVFNRVQLVNSGLLSLGSRALKTWKLHPNFSNYIHPFWVEKKKIDEWRAESATIRRTSVNIAHLSAFSNPSSLHHASMLPLKNFLDSNI